MGTITIHMNRVLISFLLCCFFWAPGRTYAANHNIVTGNYLVNGVCDQCKKRIEDAAYIKGVKYAAWNVETHNLTIKYDSSKTSPELILKSIAKAGHDSEKMAATDDDYNKLPSCCKYRSGIKKH